ncbi:hypothetical protein FRC04_001463 [Tulasnella sp. 424]|nr:hypothetical protein FRC04_001463 [Tulasnella sp. 424]KAG8974521.1 hypothetical protein FRC05_007153 [Tulasnella sp. 425]
MLPADAVEHNRLDLQHEMLTTKIGGLFLCPDAVQRALAPRPNARPAVLDVGTGSGSWAIGVARMFPHADVVGLDLAPVNPISEPPPNCQFECGDVNKDLSRYNNSFDVIHARAIIQGIHDYPAFLGQVVKMLRPGGVFISLEAQFEIFDVGHRSFGTQIPDDPNFSWMHKLLTSAGSAMIARNPGLPELERIPDRLAESGDVWQEVSSTVLYTPIGAWDRNMPEIEQRVGDLMARNCLQFTDAARPLLNSLGEPPEVVDLWVRNTQAELKEARVKQYGRWPGVWAIKKSTNAELS